MLAYPLSPNENFLRYLILPQDNELAIDLRQTAVVVMAHLDRLATPCMPPQCSSPTSHKVMYSKLDKLNGGYAKAYVRGFICNRFLNFALLPLCHAIICHVINCHGTSQFQEQLIMQSCGF